MDLRPRLLHLPLGVGACPLQGFMRNASPGKNNRSAHCVSLTHLWLWAWYIVIYTEREWGSTQYYFIDNKMMHLQYSAFGGKAR